MIIPEIDFIIKKLAAELKKDELQIPSIPDYVNILSKELNNPNLSVQELTKIICSDTGITSQVIRTAQTMRYSNPGTTVTSIPTAISRIGVNSSLHLALALAIEQNFKFKLKLLNDFCTQKLLYSNRLCTYALGMASIKYGKIPPVIFDYLILASSLLNICYLPFLYQIENYYIQKQGGATSMFLTKDELAECCDKISISLGTAILRHWQFDKSFESTITLVADPSQEFYINALAYSKLYVNEQESHNLSLLSPKNLGEVISIKLSDEDLEHLKLWMYQNNILY